ncbi:MAG: hypothetical protein WCI68_05415 [Actinomycetes bacterium]
MRSHPKVKMHPVKLLFLRIKALPKRGKIIGLSGLGTGCYDNFDLRVERDSWR